MPFTAKVIGPNYAREFILSRVVHEDCGHTSECWIWQSGVNSRGYGTSKPAGHRSNALMHRFAYEAFVEAIPSGLVIDHLCAVTRCVNPEHLEAVTQRENVCRAARRNVNGTWGWRGKKRATTRQASGGEAATSGGPVLGTQRRTHRGVGR